MRETSTHGTGPKLEIVLKCDSAGSLDAVAKVISEAAPPEVDVRIIHSGIGPVAKSDIFLAETAGRLVIGFQVGVLPHIDRMVREHNIEVRLYEVIYTLMADIRQIAESLVLHGAEEQVVGSAKVIALFKGGRRGIIIGCEVGGGFLAVGHRFRIISAMGPVYSGTIESLHIGDHAVQKAARGEQAGIRIKDFDKVKIGDLVESFRPSPEKKVRAWEPKGEIVRKT
jgi:translation initiation factor IF-2